MQIDRTSSGKEQGAQPSFRPGLYLLLVFGLSWPFQFAYAILGEDARPLLLVSMVMAGVATFIAGRYLFRDGFKSAGWSWGKPIHYLSALALALLLWLLPVVVEQTWGMNEASSPVDIYSILASFILALAITLVPAFGEEFSWRGYLLPRLMEGRSKRRALLLHGLITWAWHWPVLVVMGLALETGAIAGVSLVMLVSLVPTVLHAVVFAYFWSASGSLAVATFYHASFDEVRDTLEAKVGFGPLSDNWQMLVLTVLGLLLLRKTSWLHKDSEKRD